MLVSNSPSLRDWDNLEPSPPELAVSALQLAVSPPELAVSGNEFAVPGLEVAVRKLDDEDGSTSTDMVSFSGVL